MRAALLGLAALAGGARAEGGEEAAGRQMRALRAQLPSVSDEDFEKICGRPWTALNSSDSGPRDRLAASRDLRTCWSWARAGASLRAADAAAPVATINALEAQTAEQEKSAGGSTDFQGIAFGVGVGLSCYDRAFVTAARLVGTRVVAEETKRCMPRVVLETHSYELCRLLNRCKSGMFGIGPYFGVVTDTQKALSGFSMGIMAGWKDATPTDSSRGFSVGVGAILDAGVRRLAIDEGNLPAGEEIRFLTKSEWSWTLLFSRTF